MLTQKLSKQGYRYHKLRKTFSKFYRRYYDLISKFQVGLKSLLRQGLSEPDFYGDLVYKLKKIVGSNNFSAQSDFRLYEGSDLKTYLLMRWWVPDALAFCRAHRGLPVGFLLLRYSVLFISLSLLYLLVIS